MSENPIFQRLLLAFLGVLIALTVHSWNASEVNLTDGRHVTADDASYSRPAQNWWETGIWKDNTTGASAYVQRPPVTGIISLFSQQLFGSGGFFWLNLLLYGWGIYLLPAIFQRYISKKSSLIFTWIYILLPCFWGFLSYYITEAFTPFLVILMLWLTTRKEVTYLTLILLLCCIIWLTRPLLIVLFPIVIFLLYKNGNAFIRMKNPRLWAPVLIGLITVGIWEIRKLHYLQSEEYSIHSIYHSSNQTPFRPAHAAITNLFRIWEYRPEVIHEITHIVWTENDTESAEKSINQFVSKQTTPVPKHELKSILTQWHTLNLQFLNAWENHANTHLLQKQEQILCKQIESLRNRTASKNRLLNHVITPLKSARFLLSKSQLNLEIFQSVYRGNQAIEFLRYVCLGMILSCFCLTCGVFLFVRIRLWWYAFGILIYFFYLFYVQRMNEDRYVIPALPALYFTACVYWTSIIQPKVRALLSRIRIFVSWR